MKASEDLIWTVNQAGYQWTDTKKPVGADVLPNHLLKPIMAGPARFRARRYAPLRDCPALFQVFAKLRLDPQELVAFANQYGRLIEDTIQTSPVDRGHPPFRDEAHKLDYGKRQPAQFYPETYDLWCEQIVAMRQAVDVWECVQEADEETLAKHLTWWQEPNGAYKATYNSHPQVGPKEEPDYPDRRTHGIIFTKTADEMVNQGLNLGDLTFPAREQLRRVINQHFEGLVMPQSIWSADHTRIVLGLVPKNLLGALWLQFAEAVASDKIYRLCKECSKQYEVNESERAVRHYCSNKCRSKAYRERQNEARKKHAAGQSFEDIARELDSDVKTIKVWVVGSKE